VAAKALDIAHFDPVTGDDRGGELTDEADQPTRCVQACYDCLLSYSNQPAHARIDRHRAVGILLGLATATADLVGRAVAPAGATVASGPVADFIAWLAATGYRPPDEVCAAVRGTVAVPDLIYQAQRVGVFVHAAGATPGQGRDSDAEESLLDAGWSAIRVPAGQWQAAVDKYPSVFGEHRGAQR
jgi:hypothetical protein